MKLYKEYKEQPELLQTILHLEEYRIPYEQKENEIYLDDKQKILLDKILLEAEEEKKQKWISFEYYESEAILEETTQLLERHNIPYKVSKPKSPLVEEDMFNQMERYHILLIRFGDLNKVRLLQMEQIDVQKIVASDEYYLKNLSDKELLTIIETPEDNSVMDLAGARYLLQQRGIAISNKDMEIMRLHHLIVLSRPKEATNQDLFYGYLSAILGGFVGLSYSLYFLYDKTILSNGRKVITFANSTRKHGLTIFFISIIMSLIVIYFILSRLAIF